MKAPHLLILMTISQIDGFEKNCPMSSQWGFRSRAICNTTPEYYCLFDDNSKLNREFCRAKPDFLAPGNKYVIRGNLDGEDCDKDSYQPFIYRTNETSRCALLKSKCKEEGQIIYRNGSTTTDRSCRCDYTRHYAFVVQPQNSCYCDLSMEDCSCYIKQCPSRTHLSADYVCTSDYIWDKQSICESIKVSRYFNPYYNFKNMSIEYINVTSADHSILMLALTVLILGFIVTGIYILSRLCIGLKTSQDPPKMAVEPVSCDPPLEGKSMKSCAVENELKIEIKNNDGYQSETVSFTPSSLTALAEPDVPSVPKDLEVTEVTDNSVTLKWSPPVYNGGAPIVGYRIERKELSANRWIRIASLKPDVTWYRETNLLKGQGYIFRVFSENEKGLSEPAIIENVDVPQRPMEEEVKHNPPRYRTVGYKKNKADVPGYSVKDSFCTSDSPLFQGNTVQDQVQRILTDEKVKVQQEAIDRIDSFCTSDSLLFRGNTVQAMTQNQFQRISADEKVKVQQEPMDQTRMTQAQVAKILADEKVKFQQEATDRIEKRLRVAIIGKSGVGKSSTANHIIGEKVFFADSSAMAVTQKCQFAQCRIDTRDLLLIDTPGTCVSGENTEQTNREINNCVLIGSPGLHAVLFAVELNRFKKEDENVIERFKKFFGEDIINHSIVVLTHGDELKKSNKSLEDFLKGAESFKKFLKACGDRYITFDNDLQIDSIENRLQVEKLLSLIELHKVKKECAYTTDVAKEAERKARKKLEDFEKRYVEKKISQLCKENANDLINKKLQELKEAILEAHDKGLCEFIKD